MGVEVFPGAGSGPLVVAAGSSSAVLTLPDLSAIDPVTGRTSLFVRVVQVRDPDDAGAGGDPVLRLGAGPGPLVAVGSAATPLTAQAGGPAVAVATAVAEGQGVYLVEVEVLEPQPQWTLQIGNADTRAHRYTGVAAGSNPATGRGWLDVVSAAVSVQTQAGQTAPAQQVVIANYGPGPLTLAAADGTDLGSGFRLVSVSPRPIGANQHAIATIGFSAPAGPAAPPTVTVVHDIASDDPAATDITGHNKRLTLRATIRPRTVEFIVRLPDLGESVTEVVVTRWLKKVGDPVDKDEFLLEVASDKVDAAIPSPVGGVLLRIIADEDDTVVKGGELAAIAIPPN